MTKPLTPEQVAEHYGVHIHAVYGWIKSKALVAIDVSSRGGKRATYLITEQAMRDFEQKRSTAPQAKAGPKERRRQEVVEQIV